MTSKARPGPRRSSTIDCQDLLEQQAQANKEAMQALSDSHAQAMQVADRAAERRDNTFRFILFAALTILGGLIGMKNLNLHWP